MARWGGRSSLLCAPLKGAETQLDGHVLRVVWLEEDDLGSDRLHARHQLLDRVDAAVVDEQHTPGPRPRVHVLKLPRSGAGTGSWARCAQLKGKCLALWLPRRAHHGAVDRVQEALPVEAAVYDVHALEAGLGEDAQPGVLPAASEKVEVRHGRAATLRDAARPVRRLLVAPDLVDAQQLPARIERIDPGVPGGAARVVAIGIPRAELLGRVVQTAQLIRGRAERGGRQRQYSS